MMSEAAFVESVNKDFPSLRLTLNEVLTPHQPFVQRYYSNMIEQVMRIPIAEVCGITKDQHDFLTNNMDGLNLAEHVFSYNLYKAVKYVFEKFGDFGVADFRFSDIMFPFNTPKRSFVLMSNLYIFFSYCSEFDEKFDIANEVPAKLNFVNSLRKEITELKDKILENENKKMLFAKEIRDFKEELTELAERNEEEQRTIREIQFEEEELTEKLASFEDQESRLQNQFIEIDNERKRLECLIVSDSDQVISQLQKLENKKEGCMKRLSDLERKKEDGSFKVTQFDAIINLYDILLKVLEEDIKIGATSFDLKGISHATGALKKELQCIVKEEEQLNLKIKERIEAATSHQAELLKLGSEEDTVKQSGAALQQKLQTQISDLQQTISEFVDNSQMQQEEIIKLSKKMDDMAKAIQTHQIKIKDIDTKAWEDFRKFELALLNYIKQVSDKIDNPKS